MDRLTQGQVNRASINAGEYVLSLPRQSWRILDTLHEDLRRYYEHAEVGLFKVNHDGGTVQLSVVDSLMTVQCMSHQLLSALMLASLASTTIGKGAVYTLTVIVNDGFNANGLHLTVENGVIQDRTPPT